jgi:hypothetical protein
MARRPSDGRILALVPLGAAVLVGALAWPRAIVPTDIPLPVIDGVALGAVERADDAAARDPAPLALEAREVGTHLRALWALETKEDISTAEVDGVRVALDRSIAAAVAGGFGRELLRLRAVQLSIFLDELDSYAASGVVRDELRAVSGGFLEALGRVGWLRDRRPVLGSSALRAAWKLGWNAATGLGDAAAFALTLDESRALYTFYLREPHASEASVAQLDMARARAPTPEACATLEAGERMAREHWRLEKMKKLAAIDESYPVDLGVGIAHYKRGSFAEARVHIERWVLAHPDGPWSWRARGYLRAAALAEEANP